MSLNTRHASQPTPFGMPLPTKRPVFGTIVHAETGWPIDMDRGVPFAPGDEITVEGSAVRATVRDKQEDPTRPVIWLMIEIAAGSPLIPADPAATRCVRPARSQP